MIYRIDQDLARQQAGWFLVGIALFIATVTFAARRQGAGALPLRDRGAVGLGLLALPRLPGIGAQVNGAYLGVDLGPIAFQPTEFAKLCIVVFLASYLNERGEAMVIGRAPLARHDACRRSSTSGRCSSSGARRC